MKQATAGQVGWWLLRIVGVYCFVIRLWAMFDLGWIEVDVTMRDACRAIGLA